MPDGQTPFKETAEDVAVRDHVHAVAADQLRSIVERIERGEEGKREAADVVREIYAEAKANGFDVKTLRKVVADRRKSADDRDEERAMLDLYFNALGMS